MTFDQRTRPHLANRGTSPHSLGRTGINAPMVAPGIAQERARNIAATVSFLRENGYPIGRVILVSDQGEGRSSSTGQNLQAILPDTPVQRFGVDRFQRLPLRSVDMVILEASVSSGPELAVLKEKLENSVGGVYKGILEGNRATQLVEIGKPIGRVIAPKTSLGSHR